MFNLIDYEVLIIVIIIAVSCSLVGTFLVLRRQAMMADAISHTILLGIVIAFMIVPDLRSPLLIVGAVVVGVLTSVLIELLVKSRRAKEDSATGIIFPLLFSIAVIIISLEFRSTHLDIDAVLIGRIEHSSIKQLVLFNQNLGALKIYDSLLILIINILLITILYKEYKIASFDSAFSKVIGISPAIIHYLIMTQASLTAVTAFDAVGSILVIALMVGPPITSLLLTKDLMKTLILAVIIAVFNSIAGYIFALYFDVTISGVISVVTLITFLVVLFLEPKKGIISSIIKREIQKREFYLLILLIHIASHESEIDAHLETHHKLVIKELKWSKQVYERTVKKALSKQYLYLEENIYFKISKNGIDYLSDKELEFHI